jgi:acyl dehydratase
VTIDQLVASVGTHLGFSQWMDISQERINDFAKATDDHQWIHVDPERATKGPFGQTIAHGYLTLSLAVPMISQVLSVEGVRMGINYGANKVRFPAPVLVGSRLRVGATLAGVEEVTGGVQVVIDAIFEIEGQEKPACVAQVLYRYYR